MSSPEVTIVKQCLSFHGMAFLKDVSELHDLLLSLTQSINCVFLEWQPKY